MKKTPATSAFALAIALAICGAGTLFGMNSAAAAEHQVSIKLGKPLTDAKSLNAERKYKDALAKLDEADAIPGKTPWESFVIDELKVQAYTGLQDYGNAAKVAEAALASGQAPESQTPTRLKTIFQLYGAASNFNKMAEAGNRYLKTVGPDADVEAQLAQVYSSQRNYKQAEDTIRAAIKIAESKDATVKEDWIALLRFVEHEQGNAVGEQAALEMLVQHYPSAKYWEDLLDTASKNIKGPTASLDVARLRLLTVGLKTEKEYTEMAEDSLNQLLPAEAKKILDNGMQKGILGQGPQKDRHLRLMEMAKKLSADDLNGLAAHEAEAQAAPTGDPYVKLGLSYWSFGQNDKAVAAIQSGLKKGVKDRDDAELRLGIVLITAGKKSQAADAFRAIKANSTAAQVAHLWTLYAASR